MKLKEAHLLISEISYNCDKVLSICLGQLILITSYSLLNIRSSLFEGLLKLLSVLCWLLFGSFLASLVGGIFKLPIVIAIFLLVIYSFYDKMHIKTAKQRIESNVDIAFHVLDRSIVSPIFNRSISTKDLGELVEKPARRKTQSFHARHSKKLAFDNDSKPEKSETKEGLRSKSTKSSSSQKHTKTLTFEDDSIVDHGPINSTINPQAAGLEDLTIGDDMETSTCNSGSLTPHFIEEDESFTKLPESFIDSSMILSQSQYEKTEAHNASILSFGPSKVYFKFLLSVFLVVQLNRFDSLWIILSILFVVNLINRFQIFTKIGHFLFYFTPRRELLMPNIIWFLWRKVNLGLLNFLRSYTSQISTTIVLILSVTVIFFIILFFMVKIQCEIINVANLISQDDSVAVYLKNSNLDISSYLKEFKSTGHDYIADKVVEIFSNITDTEAVEKIQEKSLILWDTIYFSYFDNLSKSLEKNLEKNLESEAPSVTTPIGPVQNATSGPTVINFTDLPRSEPDQSDSVSPKVGKVSLGTQTDPDDESLIDFLSKNKDTVASLATQIYEIIQKNADVVYHILSTTSVVILYGGMALVNFLLSFVIFLTSLFYGIVNSTDGQFYPIQFLMSLTPLNLKQNEPEAENDDTFLQPATQTNYGQYIQDAIMSVFGASLKMAIFYGVFTYLTHTIFGIELKYIPAVLSAITAVLPFIGCYWMALPGVLYLYFIKKSFLQAITLFLLHISPLFFVDTAIYSDVSQGHPYFTALSVAGGLYIFGLEGAIYGPLVFCFLLTLVRIYRKIVESQRLNLPQAQENPSQESFVRMQRNLSGPAETGVGHQAPKVEKIYPQTAKITRRQSDQNIKINKMSQSLGRNMKFRRETICHEPISPKKVNLDSQNSCEFEMGGIRKRLVK